MNSTQCTCKSGLIGYRQRLQDIYTDYDSFRYYSDLYGLSRKLGFCDSNKAWNANPIVEGSVNPVDYCRVMEKME